jgi:WD40 repeat protein
MRLEATKVARNNLLSNGPSVSLPVRNSRSCNALAFSTTDPNFLAVGLDKVRGDPSLVIWDIQAASPALSMNVGTGSYAPQSPLRSTSRADAGARTDVRVVHQHAPTEIVSSLAWVPQSANLLLGSISHRWLRLFDLRSSTPTTTNVAIKVHGIATDPCDSNRFASFGERIITVWDVRRMPNPLLTFTEGDAAADGARPHTNGAYSSIEFSSTRRGTLATMGKDGSYVRFWDLQKVQATVYTSTRPSKRERSRESSTSSTRAPRLSWANLPWAASTGMQSTHGASPLSSPFSLVLSDTRKSKTD